MPSPCTCRRFVARRASRPATPATCPDQRACHRLVPREAVKVSRDAKLPRKLDLTARTNNLYHEAMSALTAAKTSQIVTLVPDPALPRLSRPLAVVGDHPYA